jgi:2-oxoglutarate ferredoxin oxidoreductase subunit beta
VQSVTLHDGSVVKLHKVAKDYDATNRDAAYAAIRDHQRRGEVMTGLLYLSPDSKDVHDQNETVAAPLYNLPHDQLCPATTPCRS